MVRRCLGTDGDDGPALPDKPAVAPDWAFGVSAFGVRPGLGIKVHTEEKAP